MAALPQRSKRETRSSAPLDDTFEWPDTDDVPALPVKRPRINEHLNQVKAAAFAVGGSDFFRRLLSLEAAAVHLRQLMTDADALCQLRLEHATYTFYQSHPYALKRWRRVPKSPSVASIMSGPVRPIRLCADDKVMTGPRSSLLTSVSALRIDYHKRDSMSRCQWPLRLEYLDFADSYSLIGQISAIPTTLTTLLLSNQFNKDIAPNVLPRTLTCLQFGTHFNRRLSAGSIPASVTKLTFGRRSFGSSNYLFSRFNQILQAGDLPSSLIELSLGSSFRAVIAVNILPPTLTSLDMGIGYFHPFANDVLPLSLKHIRLNCPYYTHALNFKQWAPNLSSLNLSSDHQRTHSTENMFPSSLTSLTLYMKIQLSSNLFPHSLTELRLSSSEVPKLEANMLPPNLTFLSMPAPVEPLMPNVFPPHLRSLQLFGQAKYPIVSGVIPQSLTALNWAVTMSAQQDLDQLVANIFPPQVRKVTLDNNSVALFKSLPKSVTDLDLSASHHPFDMFDEGVLPNNLITLRLGQPYPTSIRVLAPFHPPPTLIEIFLPFNFRRDAVPLGNYAIIERNDDTNAK